MDQLHLALVVEGLDAPTFVTALPGSEVLLVVEKSGRVRWLEGGLLRAEPFLDLSDHVLSSGEEQGLFSLAFHPGFADSGRFFVHYSSVARPGTREGDGVIAEFTLAAGASSADPASERRVLRVAQVFGNHNGGMIAFGPRDGFLYIGLGDGGSGGDPQRNGQNLGAALGKILRIDVDPLDQAAYGIPEGNLAGDGVEREIWSYGWRNPWRFSFDSETGDMYIGDVGQSGAEVVDYEPSGSSGRNYGWNTMEGSFCFLPRDGCDQSGMVLPVVEYTHDLGCSVTGGYVYRGRAIPGLRGVYFYADFCSGLIGALRMADGQLSESLDATARLNPGGIKDITSFGTDSHGELYLVTLGGSLYRLEAD